MISDVETGETVFILFGRLVFAGHISLFAAPVALLASEEENISFVDVENGTIRKKIIRGFGRVFRAVVSHNASPILVFTTWNHQNRRSTIQTYELIEALPSPDDTKLKEPLPSPSTMDMKPFNTDQMNVMFEGDSRDGVSSLAVSRSKKPFICSGHYDFVVRVWDLIERKLLFALKDHIDWVVSVAIWKGPEPLAVSGSSDGTIKLWDLRTGLLVTTCEGHLRDVWAVTVTEGRKPLIISASVDRTMRSWDVNGLLCDIKWDRRKNFCKFVYCCNLLDRGATCRKMGLGGEIGCIATDKTLYAQSTNLEESSDDGISIKLANLVLPHLGTASPEEACDPNEESYSTADSAEQSDERAGQLAYLNNLSNSKETICDDVSVQSPMKLVFQSRNLCGEVARYL